MKKLVTPRVVATVFMLFFLAIISDLVGLVGGTCDREKLLLQLDARQYWANAWETLVFQDDIVHGIESSPLFSGFIIATIGLVTWYERARRRPRVWAFATTTQAMVAASGSYPRHGLGRRSVPDGYAFLSLITCPRRLCPLDSSVLATTDDDSAPAIIFEDVAIAL